MEKYQANSVKHLLGLDKRSHHTNLLKAICVPKVGDVIKNNVLSVYFRSMQVNSPLKNLNMYFLYNYVMFNNLIPGTLVKKISDLGMCPIKQIFENQKLKKKKEDSDGMIDSLRYLIYHENF